MTWLAYQHRRLILRLLFGQLRSTVIRWLHRGLIGSKRQQQGIEPALEAFRDAVFGKTIEAYNYLPEPASATLDISEELSESQGASWCLGVEPEPPAAGFEPQGSFHEAQPPREHALSIAEMKAEFQAYIAKFPTTAETAAAMAGFFQHYETEQQLDQQAVERLKARGAATGYTLVPVVA